MVLLVSCVRVAPETEAAETEAAETELTASRIDTYLRTRAAETDFSGAVLVARGADTLAHVAFGLADRELGVPISTGSIFRIGSLTKPVTATAVLLLAEEGKLALEDSFCEFLRHCPRAWQGVLLRHLLGHTSGIPDLFGHLEEVPVQETVQEIDRLLTQSNVPGLNFKPGEDYSYSNFNYMLLGYVIEAASGQFWEEYLSGSMFTPLKMTDTGYDDVWAIVEGRARGYTLDASRMANIEYDDHAAYAAGGLRSTLRDLRHWHDAYVGDQLIGAPLRQVATRAGLGDYGYGWQVLELFDRQMYNHSGGIDGFSSHLAYYPEERVLIIVLSNNDREDAKATACDLASLTFNYDPSPTGTLRWFEQPRQDRCRQAP